MPQIRSLFDVSRALNRPIEKVITYQNRSDAQLRTEVSEYVVCLTLALVHVLVWWRRREARANLLFALTAVATAAFAACELWMMRAETTGAFGMAVRWAHVPAWVLIVSLVGFVRLYLRAGRLWLAWTVCGVRTLSLILNFVCTPNLNYREITATRLFPR
jgi:two-component system sensor kinase FixL